MKKLAIIIMIVFLSGTFILGAHGLHHSGPRPLTAICHMIETGFRSGPAPRPAPPHHHHIAL